MTSGPSAWTESPVARQGSRADASRRWACGTGCSGHRRSCRWRASSTRRIRPSSRSSTRTSPPGSPLARRPSRPSSAACSSWRRPSPSWSRWRTSTASRPTGRRRSSTGRIPGRPATRSWSRRSARWWRRATRAGSCSILTPTRRAVDELAARGVLPTSEVTFGWDDKRFLPGLQLARPEDGAGRRLRPHPAGPAGWRAPRPEPAAGVRHRAGDDPGPGALRRGLVRRLRDPVRAP